MESSSLRSVASYQLPRTVLLGMVALFCSLANSSMTNTVRAGIFATAYGSNGEAGEINGFPVRFGTGGSVFELDAFVAIADGSAKLSAGLPEPLTQLEFSHETVAGGSGLQLTYRFKHGGLEQISNAWFFVFVDPEIAGDVDYTNEFGIVTGIAGNGFGDSAPDSWEIDEPGFESGNLYSHLVAGTLDNSNGVPLARVQDVAMALGFNLGALNPTNAAEVRITLSDTVPNNGAFTLTARDLANANDSLSLFGSAIVDRRVRGDYDGNGIVDSADYGAWRPSVGSRTDLAADGNGNGVVDAADYVLWRRLSRSFLALSAVVATDANTQVTSSTVPEPKPATVMAAVAAWLALIVRAQRNDDQSRCVFDTKRRRPAISCAN